MPNSNRAPAFCELGAAVPINRYIASGISPAISGCYEITPGPPLTGRSALRVAHAFSRRAFQHHPLPPSSQTENSTHGPSAKPGAPCILAFFCCGRVPPDREFGRRWMCSAHGDRGECRTLGTGDVTGSHHRKRGPGPSSDVASSPTASSVRKRSARPPRLHCSGLGTTQGFIQAPYERALTILLHSRSSEHASRTAFKNAEQKILRAVYEAGSARFGLCSVDLFRKKQKHKVSGLPLIPHNHEVLRGFRPSKKGKMVNSMQGMGHDLGSGISYF